MLDPEQVLDYAELIHRAVLLAEQPDVRRRLREEFRLVLVDEYQDTDPGQVALLQAIAGDGRDLVVVGDPDQSIYAFRGADVRGLLRFPDEFRTTSGAPAAQVALGDHPTIRYDAAARLPQRGVRLGVPGTLDRATFERFRNPDASAAASTAPARSRRTSTRRPVPSSSTSPTCCAGRMSPTGSAGTRWRCWSGPAGGRSRRCAGRWVPPGSRSTWPVTSCRSRASRPCTRCCWRCARSRTRIALTVEAMRTLALLAARRDGRRAAAPAGPDAAPPGPGAGRGAAAAAARRTSCSATRSPTRSLLDARQRRWPRPGSRRSGLRLLKASDRRRRPVPRRRRRCGRCGRTRHGCAGCGHRRPAAVRRPGPRTGTWTRCARCSTPPAGPRSRSGSRA